MESGMPASPGEICTREVRNGLAKLRIGDLQVSPLACRWGVKVANQPEKPAQPCAQDHEREAINLHQERAAKDARAGEA
jgi:hypothetical protein